MEVIDISCEEIITEYSDLVYRIAITHVKKKEDAEDIFQEVFISLIKNISKIEDTQHLKHWLIRVTINRAKNYHLCFWKRKVELSSDNIEDKDENIYYEDFMIDEIRNEIKTLSPKLRCAVYLYYYEGYSVNEIASIIEVPVGTIKSRLHTARNTLKNKLREVYSDEF